LEKYVARVESHFGEVDGVPCGEQYAPRKWVGLEEIDTVFDLIDACGKPRIGFDGPFGTEISPLVSVDGSEGSFGVVVETLFVEKFSGAVWVPNFYAMFVKVFCGG
jgi:hypothetical protein